jgi:GH24 family phage-related lysozyme (muramidase)
VVTPEDKWIEARTIATVCVQHFEGCHLTSYVLPDENWATLGWGEAIPLSQHPKTITQAEADARFHKVLLRKEAALRKEIPAAVLDKLTARQLAGILSFRYNVKDSSWLDAKCNTRKALVRGDVANFWRRHGQWIRGNGNKILGGLQRRRHVENDLGADKSLEDIEKANWYQGRY